MTKTTAPFGVPLKLVTEATVPVKVTLSPRTDGFADDTTWVVVLARLTTKLRLPTPVL